MESELLALLDSAKPNRDKLDELINALEAAASIDLSNAHQQQQLEGVWELRWSSSKQPYLQVQPWLENLQVLMPSQGRGMNLLRLPPPLAAAGVAVEAELSLDPPKRVQVRFRRGGLLGPQLAGWRANVMTGIQQSFPAWLDITALSDELRICQGQNGTIFCLRKRHDLSAQALLPPLAKP
ncbi:MAG: PAP/fibrillin family protein [Cyanobacteriota bacterium]|nr:PAP/fibrillin family protein [Cyanobacteriota bacterium]